MHLIIISGPSGSGKTTLSEKLLKELHHGIILNTDNYYRTGIISKLLSKILTSYFDKKISFNCRKFKRDLMFILENGFINKTYEYDFKNKNIKIIQKKTDNIKFIIVEGIFGQEAFEFLSSKKCILIKLIETKSCCMERVIKRDIQERGKTKNLAKRDFIEAWKLFHINKKKNNSKKYLKTIVLKKKIDINFLIKKLTKLMN